MTSHEAGLAVPDWPTSYGRWFPPMVGNVFWEHGHRMIAGSVGILTLILVLLIQFRESRKWLKVLAWSALGMVILQALLGGLTVLKLLPAPVSMAHAILAQTFFCAVIAATYFLSPEFKNLSSQIKASYDGRLKRLLLMTLIFIYVQLFLGATVRHTGHAIVFHIILAFLILLHVLLVMLRIFRFFPEKFLTRLGLGLGLMILIQIFLGMGSFIFTRMLTSTGYAPSMGEVVFTAAHQTLGALVLGTAFLMTIRVWR
ncbi:MAG: COX15/CtaA family protein [Candidatus Omnitrophica bacterium]|nr:COX15/CtaA family protein [Candidatus Omnitrophota bacterium]